MGYFGDSWGMYVDFVIILSLVVGDKLRGLDLKVCYYGTYMSSIYIITR